ncbi:MAG TPA: DinB family protein [Bacteroidota bacterium]|nr:DinB family protein [Bacteroidota bacterium]
MAKKANLALLLQILDEAYSKRTWHGTNLRGSIRGMSANQAAWRPGKNRHNVWEIVVHCAYWKYTVARRITGEKRGSFPLKGSNWFERPGGKGVERDWRQDVKLLDSMHRKLREVVAGLDPRKLSSLSPKKQWTLAQTIFGVALHDTYHTGQIQLLKRMMKR